MHRDDEPRAEPGCGHLLHGINRFRAAEETLAQSSSDVGSRSHAPYERMTAYGRMSIRVRRLSSRERAEQPSAEQDFAHRK